MVDAVNAFHPDILFIGMTAPKQEKWAYAHKDRLNARVICCIGAVFDFYAGTVERPSSFMISIGLEWFGRLVREPRRLWRRYLYYGPIFLWLLFKEKSSRPRKSVRT
jgi:N-acetylglucosaminyldiphosphoundecaprenol N-acetyl-beta-D-mannosaminyltransferase